jgi:putative PIN family toxin of toxin-antitoxin system
MRVILDTNIYISYLLLHGERRVITEVVEACLFDESVELIAPQELFEELHKTVQGKPYLRDRITEADLNELLEALRAVAIIPAPLEDLAPLSRDPDDDYLLAYGLLEEADYLVTGDDDLLALGEIDTLRIIRVPVFHQLLISK